MNQSFYNFGTGGNLSLLLNLLCKYLTICITLLILRAVVVCAEPNDPEVGLVNWQRDFDKALAASSEVGKPLFVLFQEVPGCHGCKKFGQSVLTDPLLVEAIETEFIPVLIYNNRGGKDAELLKRYREPSWNFQVIRFLDSAGRDIIPRKDKVWTREAVLERMISALQKYQRKVPEYLTRLNFSMSAKLESMAISMHCFWTGERILGALPGVLRTQAGWLDGGEVTRVWFLPESISSMSIIRAAVRANSADRIYLAADTIEATYSAQRKSSIAEIPKIEVFNERNYRVAKPSDQKKQIQGTPYEKLQLSEYQLTKVNAYVRQDDGKARSYLSPRQLDLLRQYLSKFRGTSERDLDSL
jgi:hypothetical protein